MYCNCIYLHFKSSFLLLSIPFFTCTNDFYARFSLFLIFLKFSEGTFHRDNLAVHLFKYAACLYAYVFE